MEENSNHNKILYAVIVLLLLVVSFLSYQLYFTNQEEPFDKFKDNVEEEELEKKFEEESNRDDCNPETNAELTQVSFEYIYQQPEDINGNYLECPSSTYKDENFHCCISLDAKQ